MHAVCVCDLNDDCKSSLDKGTSSFMIYLNGVVAYALLFIEMDRFLKKATCQIPPKFFYDKIRFALTTLS